MSNPINYGVTSQNLLLPKIYEIQLDISLTVKYGVSCHLILYKIPISLKKKSFQKFVLSQNACIINSKTEFASKRTIPHLVSIKTRNVNRKTFYSIDFSKSKVIIFKLSSIQKKKKTKICNNTLSMSPIMLSYKRSNRKKS